MNPQDLDKLIKKDRYQVFVFTSPGSIPLSFARHPWFVVNRKGIISRWEILHKRNLDDTSFNYLHKNFLPPTVGIWVLPFWGSSFYWQSELLGSVEGDDNSTARKMADLIESSKENYPYCDKYLFTGPNSDTYGQWVLDHFPELDIKLPWNCFGKNYKK